MVFGVPAGKQPQQRSVFQGRIREHFPSENHRDRVAVFARRDQDRVLH